MRKILLLLIPSALLLANPPERVISLSPNITEIVFKIGAGDLLVGRTEFCIYPEAALQIPSVGGYLNPDYEKIAVLQPDLILMLPNPEMERQFRRLGISTRSLPDENIDQILAAILEIGDILNRLPQAQQVVAGIEDTLKAVSGTARKIPTAEAVLVVGREKGSLRGIYVAGQDTYLSEIWTLCGGKNIFNDVPRRYFDVTKESLIQRCPFAILEFRLPEDRDKIAGFKSDWQALPIIPAVQNHQIYIFTERYFLIPGPRISRIAVAFSDVIQNLRQQTP